MKLSSEDKRAQTRSNHNVADESDSADDEQDKRARLTAGAERRPSLLVSQIKSAQPCTGKQQSAASSMSESPTQCSSGASPTPRVAVIASKAARDDDDDDVDESDDEDPEEKSPREATPQMPVPVAARDREASVESESDAENESKRESEDHSRSGHDEALTAPPSAAKSAEYFDDDDDTRAPTLDRSAETSNQAAVVATHESKREERGMMHSGGNGVVAQDNNFVDDDWDADADTPAATSVRATGEATKVRLDNDDLIASTAQHVCEGGLATHYCDWTLSPCTHAPPSLDTDWLRRRRPRHQLCC